MLPIAAYWIFLFCLFLPGGVLLKKILGITTHNTVLTLLMGIVFYTFGFTLTAFFFSLGALSLGFWAGVALVSGVVLRREFVHDIKSLSNAVIALPSYFKILLALLTVALLLKSAQSPFITDNEGYYIQTIKWLNEYGFVKGLGNLHMLFAQNSLWHVLQAGTNFSFLTGRINDINGFLFLICALYFLTEGHRQSTGKQLHWLLFMPVFFILLIQFADAPSPDLPLYLMLPILLNVWLRDISDNGFKTAFVLFIYLGLIKMTCLPLGLIFVTGFAKRKKLAFMLAYGLPVVALWIVKNSIISGYPLFPLPFFKTGADWAMNGDVYDFVMRVTKDNGYVRKGFLPADTAFFTKLTYWITQGGLYTLMNAGTVILLVATPFTAFIRRQKPYRLIYMALLVNFILILVTSPQFRYFMHITVLCGLLCAADFYNRLRPRISFYKAISLGSTLAMFVVFFNLDLGFAKSKMNKSTGQTRLSQLYLPEPKSKYPAMRYKKARTGNLNYYSPVKAAYLYGSHDGPLPCVNERMIEQFRNKYGVVPQLRGSTISDGFYSKKINKTPAP